MYSLFLDDIRHPHECDYTPNPKLYLETDWTIARNYSEFCKIIHKNYADKKWPEVITFDHDLGDTHYGIAVTEENYDDVFVGLNEKTGMDCAKWLVNFCLEHGLKLPTCYVHSMNTVGKENIEKYLENFVRFQKNDKL